MLRESENRPLREGHGNRPQGVETRTGEGIDSRGPRQVSGDEMVPRRNLWQFRRA